MPTTLPQLTGSDKQINWANTLRDKVVDLATERGDNIDELLERTFASWWINKFKFGSKNPDKLVEIYEEAVPASKPVVAAPVTPAPKSSKPVQGTLASKEQQGATRFGAVIHFKAEATREEIETALRTLGIVDYATVRPYNEAQGEPVFYIP